MSLPACVAQWPEQVTRQVMTALYTPAADMHPEQAHALVPRELWALPATVLSRGLGEPLNDWPAELDGRKVEHRLALLPRTVLEQVAWNLGLLAHAASLRKLVLRSEVQALSEQGLQDGDWQLALSAPRSPAHDMQTLAQAPLEQWPALMRHAGLLALRALAASLGPVLGQRLIWKLPTGLPTVGADQAPPSALVHLAYTPASKQWSSHWDSCLSQIKPSGKPV